MIITRSPLRVSFAGGGTDIPAFYVKHGPGCVVSTSINRYMYVTLNQKFDGKVSVRYRVHEMADSVREINHPLIRETLLHYGVTEGVEIVIASEVPARGSGLGASSAMAVALCLALERFTGVMPENNIDYSESEDRFAFKKEYKRSLAETASMIEIHKCGSPIGKQDHYASSFGGLNYFEFNSDESVRTESYVRNEFVDELESQSMLFYMNIEHEYHEHGGSFVHKILKDQVEQVDEKASIHRLNRDNAVQLWDHMNYAVMERFQDHVNENWRLKRRIHPSISGSEIDRIVESAYSSGATAAKVCGAGGGGFLYLIVPPSMQADVRKAMVGLPELSFRFDRHGASVIFCDTENYASVKA